ncbi:uncharacterized protein LOC124437604 isoform X2 [Xenia sp. Carnegie-2017]|uniref:uncharacterized protein LOC124437604 isoform X2 n=1 Tax=Xenia sp. Carnegie-2017 TaxID=2897299 RepID=UPI001F036C45|nr:uncharacterized protein LOC124437604 isoform X2 [Xenia sp. Carnegie-2017]XP_046843529.1 uncharacterized protein LOC124437604 isoform X2 [Xenia sp. Carnegie-2017]
MSFTLPSVILKICQIVALVAGLGCVGHFTKEYVDHIEDSNSEAYKQGVFGREEFFLYTTGVGVIISIVGLVLNFSGLINEKHNAVAMAAVQGVWTIQLLVTTSLLTVIFSSFNKDEDVLLGKSVCKVWDDAADRKYDYTCGQLIGGIVSGFVAAILYGVDAIFTFKTSTEQS